MKIFYGPIGDLKVLSDNPDNLGIQIVKASKEAYLNKPEPLSPAQISEKINYLNRIISKIEGYKSEPEVSFFHLAQFYQAVILFWFEFDKEWSIPVHQAIPIIKSKDLMFYDLINSIVATNTTEEKIISCKKIVEYYKNKNK